MIKKNQELCVKKNLTKYSLDEIIAVVKRENNTKRPFLLMNKLQSKHFPSEPQKTDELFSLLAKNVKQKFSSKSKVLVIGFAETAVTVGAYIAKEFENSYYIQTTREVLCNKEFLTFEEVHSHAVNHRIYVEKLREYIESADLIVFADDEFTTGNTVLNLFKALKTNYKIDEHCTFSMASILNCINSKKLSELDQNGISLVSLIDAEIIYENMEFPQKFENDCEFSSDEKRISFFSVGGKTSPKTIIKTSDYLFACNEFVKNTFSLLKSLKNENVLIMGTEEFSFPALLLGLELQKICKSVFVQCTTRSPILPSDDENYSVSSRTRLKSFYDENRNTYLYSAKHYDSIVVLCDAQKVRVNTFEDFAKSVNSENLYFIHWRQ